MSKAAFATEADAAKAAQAVMLAAVRAGAAAAARGVGALPSFIAHAVAAEERLKDANSDVRRQRQRVMDHRRAQFLVFSAQ